MNTTTTIIFLAIQTIVISFAIYFFYLAVTRIKLKDQKPKAGKTYDAT